MATGTPADYKGFMGDFTIADRFGKSAILGAYERCSEWKNNVEYWSSLVLTLNHLLWRHWDNGNIELAKVYDTIWKKAHSYSVRHFKGNDALYYHDFLN